MFVYLTRIEMLDHGLHMLVLSGLGYWYHKVGNTREKEQNLPFLVSPPIAVNDHRDLDLKNHRDLA